MSDVLTKEQDVWFQEVLRLLDGKYTDQRFADWQGYYEGGYTPQRAVDEDSTYD